MILDTLANSSRYESLHPNFKIAFDYIKSNDFSLISPSKICLEENKLYVIISEIQGKSHEEVLIESHNQFIDIQIPILGSETVGWTSRDLCKIEKEAYNTEKDITFYHDKPSCFVEIPKNGFVIFFPEDGHAPGISKNAIKKVIFKIALQ